MISRKKDVNSLRMWSDFLTTIREFFKRRSFVEVTTRSVVEIGAFEGVLDPLYVTWSDGSAQLHTSPEIEMKQILAQAHIPIYQICQSYRDDPDTPSHSKEFTMLEFYRPFSTYVEARADMVQLIGALTEGTVAVRSISVRELITDVTGLDLYELDDKYAFAEALKAIGVESAETDTWADLFFRLMLEKIEPAIERSAPLLVFDYPPAIAALSANKLDNAWIEKFEIYWNAMELCNGCTELSDIEQLKARYAVESEQRKALGKAAHRYPHILEFAMKTMPKPTSGVAVGLDRLFACIKPLWDRRQY